MAKGDDLKNSYEEYRAKINEKFAGINMPSDTQGRIILIAVLVIMLATVWFVLDIVIVTFILTFIFHHLNKYALRGLGKTPLRVIPKPIVQTLVYLGAIVLFMLFIVENAAIIISQIMDIAALFSSFDLETLIHDIDIDIDLVAFVGQIDFNGIIWQAGQALLGGLASFGSAVLDFLIALILSFLFVLEKAKIEKIADTMKTSRIAFLYRYLLIFFGSFCYTFGKVMKVQVVIAAFNGAVFAVYLLITGLPNVIVLSIMVFLLSLIPVLGAFLMIIPLVVVALGFGGPVKALEVLIVSIAINAIEAYTINPKLMSDRTSLPLSIVIVVLIISQHYLGMWGILIGIPLFIFAMNVLNIDYGAAEDTAKKSRIGKRVGAPEI